MIGVNWRCVRGYFHQNMKRGNWVIFSMSSSHKWANLSDLASSHYQNLNLFVVTADLLLLMMSWQHGILRELGKSRSCQGRWGSNMQCGNYYFQNSTGTTLFEPRRDCRGLWNKGMRGVALLN